MPLHPPRLERGESITYVVDSNAPNNTNEQVVQRHGEVRHAEDRGNIDEGSSWIYFVTYRYLGSNGVLNTDTDEVESDGAGGWRQINYQG